MSTLPPLVLTDGERAELQRRVRAHTTPQRDLTRARMILLAADALPNRQVARLVGRHPDAVGAGVAASSTSGWPGLPTGPVRAGRWSTAMTTGYGSSPR
jgi:hypothetical protein